MLQDCPVKRLSWHGRDRPEIPRTTGSFAPAVNVTAAHKAAACRLWQAVVEKPLINPGELEVDQAIYFNNMHPHKGPPLPKVNKAVDKKTRGASNPS